MIRLRRYLVAGLLVWAPVGATIFVFRLLLGLMERLLFWLPVDYRPEVLLEPVVPFSVPGLNAIVSGVLAFAVLLATGMLAANLIGRRLVNLYESWLARIPFVRSVYGSVKHFVEVVFSDTSESFKRVLLIEYPRKGVYSMAFQTSDNLGEVQERTGETVLTVFVPTTPNPTSGFILFVPREEVVELDMPIEDALKMIVSLGVVVPKWEPPIDEGVPAEGEIADALARRALEHEAVTAGAGADAQAAGTDTQAARAAAQPGDEPRAEADDDAEAESERRAAGSGRRSEPRGGRRQVARPKAAP